MSMIFVKGQRKWNAVLWSQSSTAGKNKHPHIWSETRGLQQLWWAGNQIHWDKTLKEAVSWRYYRHHRLGRTNSPRPIIFRFATADLKMEVLRRRNILIDSGVSFAEDLCKALYKTMNRLKQHEDAEQAWSWNCKIFVKRKTRKSLMSSDGRSLWMKRWAETSDVPDSIRHLLGDIN